MSESQQEKWCQGLISIRDWAQEGSGPTPLMTEVDVTEEIVGLAETVWGPHNVSPYMALSVISTSCVGYPMYIRVQDKVLKDSPNSEDALVSAVIDPETGQFHKIIQHDALFSLLDDAPLPAESPFTIARAECIEEFGLASLRSGSRSLQTVRELDQVA